MKFFRSILSILSAAALFSPAAFAQTKWANTATQGISLSKLVSATDLGVAPADRAITVRLALQLKNKPALLDYVKEPLKNYADHNCCG